jgi:transcriptional regulator with XRE-family HTH domain
MVITLMPEKRFFAIRLRELREQAGLTQGALAERSGLASGTIRQLESGRREPSFETAAKIAVGLGVSLAAFDEDRPAPRRRSRKPKPKD